MPVQFLNSTAVLLVVLWHYRRWRVMSGVHSRDSQMPLLSTTQPGKDLHEIQALLWMSPGL